jgi:hypothetical protein
MPAEIQRSETQPILDHSYFDVAQFQAAKLRRRLALGVSPREQPKSQRSAPKGRRLARRFPSGVAPPGLWRVDDDIPMAFAPGCIPSPLRGYEMRNIQKRKRVEVITRPLLALRVGAGRGAIRVERTPWYGGDVSLFRGRVALRHVQPESHFLTCRVGGLGVGLLPLDVTNLCLVVSYRAAL